jgi:KAP family P-loop domain
MMLSGRITATTPSALEDRPAEKAVVEAVTNVVADRLRDRAASVSPGSDAPVLIQVDGPGRSRFLQKLGERLDPSCLPKLAQPSGSHGDQEWAAIWFDAWQYQRLSPPWWWLMSVIDKQIRARCRRRGWLPWAWHRSRDIWGRLLRLGRDLLWVVPGVLVFSVGWELQGRTMLHVFKWSVTAAGGIAALIALLSSIRNALTRHLLAESPRGTKALLRTTDPMEDLLRRYAFLVRSTKTGVIVLIDNLDRCHATYVVEMLEGIQTLLRNVPEPKRWSRLAPARQPPLVAFVVAADRGWLCDSYLDVYQEFEACAREPGRPFGLVFLDKIFEFSLRIPTVPAAMSLAARMDDQSDPPNPFLECLTELDIRATLRHKEVRTGARRVGSATLRPVPVLRKYAVERLGEIELRSDRNQCLDTESHLDQLLADLDPGPAVQRQVETAYCVNRTTQLLAGHDVDAGEHAIDRLGLWTILGLKWPLLADHLSRRPDDLEHIANQTTPNGIDADLKVVFSDPMARQLAQGVSGVKLTAQDIERFTTPLPCQQLHAEPLHWTRSDRSESGRRARDEVAPVAVKLRSGQTV